MNWSWRGARLSPGNGEKNEIGVKDNRPKSGGGWIGMTKGKLKNGCPFYSEVEERSKAYGLPEIPISIGSCGVCLNYKEGNVRQCTRHNELITLLGSGAGEVRKRDIIEDRKKTHILYEYCFTV